jgi:hypothetical protein
MKRRKGGYLLSIEPTEIDGRTYPGTFLVGKASFNQNG